MAPSLVLERPVTYTGVAEKGTGARLGQPSSLFPVPPPLPGLREKDLVHLWEGQRFPPAALTTRHGRALQVVYRGRHSPGPGPDFVDAIIADDQGSLLKGDVELHVRASDFRGHGHHRDARYDDVVLHVVFDDDVGEDTLLSCGRGVAVVSLAPWVARRASQLRLWLAQPVLWEEPCRGAVTRRGWIEIRETIARLGRMRFRQKQSRFASALRRDSANQVLYEGLLRALGYSQNQEACECLARLLPYESLRRILASGEVSLAEALLLGRAGLLPGQRGLPLSHSPYVQELERRWAGQGGEHVPFHLWNLHGLRPENQPARRLAGAARLLLTRGPSLVGSLRELLGVGERDSLSQLIEGWMIPAEGFWRTHYDLDAAPTRLSGALIGRGRALEILINVVLPFAAAWGEAHGLPALSHQGLTLFSRLPRAGSYGAIRFLETALRPPSGTRGGQDACYQQGLLYLYRQYCTQGGCGTCPLS